MRRQDQTARSLGTVAELTEPCPNCGARMRWETSHERCPGCGWIRPCCEGAPCPVPSEIHPRAVPTDRGGPVV